MNLVKVSDYIANFFQEKGVDLVFVITGSGSIRLIQSFSKLGIRYVCTHHEQAAVMSSLTYMRTTGKPAVVIVTGGPGAINSLTGLADAFLDSLPLFIIAGQENSMFITEQEKMRSRGVQGLNMIDITKSLVKFSHCLLDPTDIGWVLDKAFIEARSGRPGPVWIEVPQNVQWEEINKIDISHYKSAEFKKTIQDKDISKVINLIQSSNRPLLLVGNGIRLSGSEKKFKSLLNYLEIPAIVSWQAADLVTDDHALFVGRAGNYGQRFANLALQNCDLLICLGTRLSLPQRGYSDHSFARSAKKVIVEIDETELSKFKFQIDLKIVGDVSNFIDKLYKELPKNKVHRERWSAWKVQINDWKNRYPMAPQTIVNSNGINSYKFIDELSNHLKNNHIIITDMGTSLTCTHATIKLKEGQNLMTSTGLGEMGFGLPGAIGACLGAKGRPVVLIVGEGSLMFNLQELQTLKNLNLDLKIFLLNNNGYLTIKHTHHSLYNSNGHGAIACGNFSDVSFPNFEKVIKSFGFKFESKKSEKNLDRWIKRILKTSGTICAEVIMPEFQELIPKINFKVDENGTIISPPLEDMYPYLGEKELAEQMLIPLYKD